MRQRIQLVCQSSGYASGWTTQTSMGSGINSVITVLASSSTTALDCYWVLMESKINISFVIGRTFIKNWLCLYVSSIIYFTLTLLLQCLEDCLACRSMQHISQDTAEQFLTLSQYPETMHKKVTLIKYFRDYMSEHLLKVSSMLLCVVHSSSFIKIFLAIFYDLFLTNFFPGNFLKSF